MIIAIGLYQGFTALDAIGPYEVLTYLPGEVVICAERAAQTQAADCTQASASASRARSAKLRRASA